LFGEVRNLKRSGGGGWGSSRSRGSTGNCYGDRCDNMGGDAESAAIVGIVIGSCCLCLLIYMLYKWCEERRKEKKKNSRRKKR